MQICQEVYFLFFPKRDAKEWEGISGLVSEPCNSKAFGKLLKTFKKISNSLRSDSEIFLNNATSQIPRITMNPQMSAAMILGPVYFRIVMDSNV